MKEIVVVGAGGMAREVEWIIREINLRQGEVFKFKGYVVSDDESSARAWGDLNVLGDDTFLLSYSGPTLDVVIAIGSPSILSRVSKKLPDNPHLEFPNLVHPQTQFDGGSSSLGIGNIVLPGSIVTTDVEIGNFNILNTAVTIGHDTRIGDCCVINPGAHISGKVNVGNSVLIGAGSVTLQTLTIGDGATIGAGAVVTRSVRGGETVVGVPARPLRNEIGQGE